MHDLYIYYNKENYTTNVFGSRFKCTECDAAFGKRQDRQKHMANQHPKIDQSKDFKFCVFYLPVLIEMTFCRTRSVWLVKSEAILNP